MPVERVTEGRVEVFELIIRAANRKSVGEIHREIRGAQARTPEEMTLLRYARWYAAVPAFARRLLIRLVQRMPKAVKKYSGTVMVTSVGMFGNGAGWGIPFAGYTLTITVGGIVARPRVVNGQLEDREHLCLTVSFDHDIVDGAPAARFVQRFRELVEGGEGPVEEL